MRMNASMAQALSLAALDATDPQVNLSAKLRGLVTANLVIENGCAILAPFTNVDAYDPARFHDRTGYECFANKFHVADFLSGNDSALEQLRQGVKCGAELGRRLISRGRFVVILAVDRDSGDAVVRFHQQRPGESWLADDLDKYRTDDVLVWDPTDFVSEEESKRQAGGGPPPGDVI